MTVKMTTSYSTYSGSTNTLTADMSDVRNLDVTGDTLVLVFNGTGLTVELKELIPAGDVEDKTKYWKTAELIKQLKGYADYADKLTKSYKEYSSNSYLYTAAEYAAKANVIRGMIADLEDGGDVWTV